MAIPAQIKPAAWGAVGGAIAAMIIGFVEALLSPSTIDTAFRRQNTPTRKSRRLGGDVNFCLLV